MKTQKEIPLKAPRGLYWEAHKIKRSIRTKLVHALQDGLTTETLRGPVWFPEHMKYEELNINELTRVWRDKPPYSPGELGTRTSLLLFCY